MQERVSLHLRLFSVKCMSLISGLFLCRCLEHCNNLLDQFNAYGTDFSFSKNSSHKTVLLCLCSLRCTCSFSQPSTADVLSPRPYAHTRTNLSSRSPSIAPIFSFQGTRPPRPTDKPRQTMQTTLVTGGTLLVALVPGFPRPSASKFSAYAFLTTLRSCRSDCHRGGGLPGVTPCPLGQLYSTTRGTKCQHLFCNFQYFFRLLVDSYSQLYRDRKHSLFRILMGLQAFFILT